MKRDGVIYALCNGASFTYGTKTFNLPDFRNRFLREVDSDHTFASKTRDFLFVKMGRTGTFSSTPSYTPQFSAQGKRILPVYKAKANIMSPYTGV